MTNSEKPKMTAAADLIDDVQGLGANVMPGFGTDWLAALSDAQSDLLTFGTARFNQVLEKQQDLLHAKGLVEVQKIQGEFVKKAMEDYSDAMAKLVNMGKSLTPTARKCSATPV